MTTDPAASTSKRRFRLPRWLGSRRRRTTAIVVLLLVVGVVALGVTDPFTSPSSGNGVTDNAYPTGTARVTEQSLSSQTEVSATLGFAGSYTVTVPNGTSAGALTSAQSTARAGETQVATDRTDLADAVATARPTNASTMRAARASVANDQTALDQAQRQMAADESLGCPASSSATVTSPVSSGASSPNVRAANSSTGAPLSGTSGPQPQTTSSSTAPSATTDAVDDVTSTSATATGDVNPNGAETTYYFEYGASPNYGSTTTPTDVGSGSNTVSVSVALVGLSPGATYHYRLVASNADGATYGQDATFQTSAAPTVSTGLATTVSSTSETLSGTVNPNGDATTYYFEYGSSASFGATTPEANAGGDVNAVSVVATISGLTAGATYDYALVASSALGTVVGATQIFQAAASSCIAERSAIADDSLALSQAKDSLTLDQLGQGSTVKSAEATLRGDEATVASDEQVLSADEANVTNANTTFTELPRLGAVIHRGESVYRLNELPVPLFYGPVPLYRALYLGVAPGLDVRELNQNLIALRFERGVASDDFTSATEVAVAAWQGSLGESETGVVALGDIVVEPGPVDVGSVKATLGEQATGGTAILSATSKRPVVTIALDTAQESEVKVGDPVVITLPNNANTPGVVTSVGAVAIEPAPNSQNSGPTVTVIVLPTGLASIGDYDQAPVNVSITNASVADVLTVPVDALLALESGGYAVEEIDHDGVHHLVAVTLGLFDDAAGRVQVSGSGLAVGQTVVVPKL